MIVVVIVAVLVCAVLFVLGVRKLTRRLSRQADKW